MFLYPLVVSSEYQIKQSCRFNDDDTAYLSRTPSASDRDTWTWSGFVKRCNLGSAQYLFAGGADNNNSTYLRFDASNDLRFEHADGGVATDVLLTNALFRDTTSWYHIVAVANTGNATESERLRLYVNGNRITSFSVENYPLQNVDTDINSANPHRIGARLTNDLLLDGYLAEVIFVDGQALGPTNFGKFNQQGVWVPKNYIGTYGTNGYRLQYANNAALGTDSSGNGNNWTVNGLASNDQVFDSPTSNYCVWNAIDTGTGTLSNGNLELAGSTDKSGTFGMSSGKWAWKITANATASFGLVQGSFTGTESTYAATSADILEFQFDANVGTLDVSVNGGAYSSVATGLTSGPYFPLAKGACIADFGQQGFSLDDPTFNYLNTKHITRPPIKDPAKYFSTLIYTGNASARSITGVGFQPDLVWIKNLDQTDEHKILDSVRGATIKLSSSSLAIEATEATGLTSFDADGFSLGTGANGYNDTGENFVAWCWKKGVTPGFDIVSYTGNGTTQTVAHSLGVVPKMIIAKSRGSAVRWTVLNPLHGATQYGYLNEIFAFSSTNANIRWGNNTVTVEPTSSVFTIGSSTDVNQTSTGYIAYLWSDVPQFSKFGSYTGNGLTSGPFVWCGFKPNFVMAKRVDSTSNWFILDTLRLGRNSANYPINPNATNVEGTADRLDILSNGFKLRTDIDPNIAGTYIFAAFAEDPFKYAIGR